MFRKNKTLGKKVKISFVKDRPGHDIRYALQQQNYKRTWMETQSTFDKGLTYISMVF